MSTRKRVHAEGEEMLAHLRELVRLEEAGELECTAMRVFHKDGTWQDIVLGGTEEEQAKALAELRDPKGTH